MCSLVRLLYIFSNFPLILSYVLVFSLLFRVYNNFLSNAILEFASVGEKIFSAVVGQRLAEALYYYGSGAV